MRKLVVFGAGKNSEDIVKSRTGYDEIVAILDNDKRKQGSFFNEIPIINPSLIHDYEYDICMISVAYPRFELFRQLLDLGVKRTKIQFWVSSHEPVRDIHIENDLLAVTMKNSSLKTYWKSESDEKEIQKLFECLYTEESYLYELGWLKSVEEKKPVDKNGNPIPWITYPAFEFIKEKIYDGINIFEYGCGYSTLYWARRKANVISVEHDKNWLEIIRKKTEKYSNCQVFHHDLQYGGGYSRFSADLKKTFFDMVVIDGRDRVNCCIAAVEALNENGIILFDNSDRKEYQEGFDFLKRNGYVEIPFWGLYPMLAQKGKTSIFYKQDKNWLF